MSFGDFVKYVKVAKMMVAHEQLMAIESSSFHAYKKDDQKNLIRKLKKSSVEFLETRVKDFKEVAANLARRMASRG